MQPVKSAVYVDQGNKSPPRVEEAPKTYNGKIVRKEHSPTRSVAIFNEVKEKGTRSRSPSPPRPPSPVKKEAVKEKKEAKADGLIDKAVDKVEELVERQAKQLLDDAMSGVLVQNLNPFGMPVGHKKNKQQLLRSRFYTTRIIRQTKEEIKRLENVPHKNEQQVAKLKELKTELGERYKRLNQINEELAFLNTDDNIQRVQKTAGMVNRIIPGAGLVINIGSNTAKAVNTLYFCTTSSCDSAVKWAKARMTTKDIAKAFFVTATTFCAGYAFGM